MKKFLYIIVIAVSLLMCACENAEKHQPMQTTTSKEEVKREYVPSEHYLKDVRLDFNNDRGYGTGWSYHIKETEEDLFYIVNEGIVHKSKETGKTELIISGDDYSITTMYIKDDKIYYSVYIDDVHTSKIFSADLNGENKMLIFDGKEYKDFEWHKLEPRVEGLKDVWGLYVDNDILYVFEEMEIFRYDMKTDTIKGFSNDVSSSAFFEGKFYYIDHGQRTFSIFEQDIKTEEIKLVCGDGICKKGVNKVLGEEPEWFDEIFSFNEEVYYKTRFPAKLYKYNPDGKDYLIADFTNDDTEDWYKNTLAISVGYEKLYYIFDKDLYEYNPETDKSEKLGTVSDIFGNGDGRGFVISGGMISYTKEDETDAYIRLEDLQ